MEIVLLRDIQLGTIEQPILFQAGETFLAEEKRADAYQLVQYSSSQEPRGVENPVAFDTQLLLVSKEHADIMDGKAFQVYEVTFNDGGWHSGSLPSEKVVARHPEEACMIAKIQRPRYEKGWDTWAKLMEFPGFELTLTKKITENN